MQKDIHPKYYSESKVTCACGESFTVGSTLDNLNVEICANCHPFFTGNEKVLDTAGRVEKFKMRAKKAVATPKAKKTKLKAKKEAEEVKEEVGEVVEAES